MVNKRGLVRIIESSIAIITILGVLIAVSIDRARESEVDISEFLDAIVEELGINASFREKVFSDENEAIEDVRTFLAGRVNTINYGFDVRICSNIEDICALTVFPSDIEGEIFSKERVVSPSFGSSQSTKKN